MTADIAGRGVCTAVLPLPLRSGDISFYAAKLWFSAIILQLSLSVLVWAAVRKGGKWLWLFPAAILLHALVDGVTVILQKSVNLVVLELIILVMAFGMAAIVFFVSKNLDKEKAADEE